MPDFNARVELDSRDFDEAAVDVLMDVVAEYHGAVARAVHGGRVELIFTVPADTIRQATITALSVVLATGHDVYALEVLPTDEFHRRIDATPMPELLSLTEAGEVLGVSRQRALALAQGGQLGAVQVGSTWVVPRAAVEARGEETGLRWSGVILPLGEVSSQRQLLEDDAVDVDDLPLPVHDERGELVGLATTIRRAADVDGQGLWTGSGILKGVAPGEYRVIPDLEVLRCDDEPELRRITRARLRGLTVVSMSDRSATWDQCHILVTSRRATMDLSRVRRPAEVVSYP